MRLLAVFVAIFVCASSGAKSQTVQCDAEYTTLPGDTLSAIAERAYGRATAYQQIVDYNPGVLDSPNRVPTEVKLYIPCEEDIAAADPGGATLQPLQAAKSNNLKILTGSEYPPYVDKGLPNGGFSFEVVERALQFEGGQANYRVDVVNDWGSHLKTLLGGGAYQLAFPWFKPNCDYREVLSEASQWRCDNLRFSEPLHEVVVTFYTTSARSAEINGPNDMNGRTICRPAGYFTHDLEVAGFVRPNVVHVAPDSPTDCFEKLLAGEVDVVSVNADTGDSMISKLKAENQIVEIIDFATIQTLHVVGMKADPKTRVNLLRVNKGLIGLRKSGAFQTIAQNHL